MAQKRTKKETEQFFFSFHLTYVRCTCKCVYMYVCAVSEEFDGPANHCETSLFLLVQYTESVRFSFWFMRF